MGNLTGLFTGTFGVGILIFLVVTAILYFFIPWMIRAINNKMTSVVNELKQIKSTLIDIRIIVKENNKASKGA